MAEAENAPETPERLSSESPPAESAGKAAGPTENVASTPPAAGSTPATGARPSGRFASGGPRGGAGGRGGYGGREFGQRGPRDRGGRAFRGEEGEPEFEERVVKINRCATVVKGGRRFSFSALVVLGDRKGSVGVGFGKANEVPPSVEKAVKDAKKNFVKVSLKEATLPHATWGSYRTSKVVLVPAVDGTGVIAGAAVRAVVECAGVKNVLSKVFGSTNPINVVKATLEALKQLRTVEEVARLRGVEVKQ